MRSTKRERSGKVLSYTFEEFVSRVKSFHGFEAVGVIVGGFMVDLAYKHLPKEGVLFDALCETPKCLPDSIQLLTPCTTGNGWLTVINVGRFALTLYDKATGEGVRVFVDPARIEAWPELKAWFLKLKTKKEQDVNLLLDEAKRAGGNICGVERVRVADSLRLRKRHRGEFAICPVCKEAYPLADGTTCLACRGSEELYGAVEREVLDR
jgi:formylmethanofuran dehydrogenase subunit E